MITEVEYKLATMDVDNAPFKDIKQALQMSYEEGKQFSESVRPEVYTVNLDETF